MTHGRLRDISMELATALFAALVTTLTNAIAHEGEHHAEPDTASTPLAANSLPERARRLPDGSLQVSKALQHLLDIRTVRWSPANQAETVSLLAEVEAQPGAALNLIAPEPGRLEAPESGAWPLPGQAVAAGQVLAWLRPLISARELARRRARLGDLEQKLVIAKINLDRLSIQAVGNDVTRVAQGNVRYEQTVAEYDALKQQRDLVDKSLYERIALRATASGRMLGVPARSGDVVAAGQPLFQCGDATRLRLVALSHDAGLGQRLRTAQVRLEGLSLIYRGQEPLAAAPGWRLLFDIAPGSAPIPFVPGQLVTIMVTAGDGGTTLPAGACSVDRDGKKGRVWIHRDAERFVPVEAVCGTSSSQDRLTLNDGDRLVTQGAALLSQYR